MTIQSVGVIGIGAMGRPMAEHLLDGEYRVFVHDVDPESTAGLAAKGAVVEPSAAAVAEKSDVTFVVVDTYEQVEAVLCNRDGILPNAKPGHIVAIGSTIAPDECISLAETAAERDVTVVGSPLCRGERAAAEGDLIALLGGTRQSVESVRAPIETFAEPKNIVRLGPVGSGMAGKAVNNVLLWMAFVADFEAMSLAKAYDLELDQLRDVLVRSSAGNWALEEWDWVYPKWAHKDMDIAMAMAANEDVALPVASLVGQLVREIDEADVDALR